MLYNKFNVSSSSPPDNFSRFPNSDYNCVVATTGQWRVSHCDQQHRVVCQSRRDTLTGSMTIYLTTNHLFTYCVTSSESSGFLVCYGRFILAPYESCVSGYDVRVYSRLVLFRN